MTALPKKEPYQKAKICTLHTRLRYNKYWSCHLLFSQHAKLTLAYLITKGILLYVLDVCGKHESAICWILPDGSGNLYINVNKCQILCCAFCDEILSATLWDFRILYTLLWAFESTFFDKDVFQNSLDAGIQDSSTSILIMYKNWGNVTQRKENGDESNKHI